jgi:hypothetical protein
MEGVVVMLLLRGDTVPEVRNSMCVSPPDPGCGADGAGRVTTVGWPVKAKKRFLMRFSDMDYDE